MLRVHLQILIAVYLRGGGVDGVEEVACLTPEEPLELGDLEQRSDEGDAYADDTFEADADAQGEEPQTAEVGINTEQMFDNHPEVEQLLKMVEKERPVSAPAGYGQRRFTETSRSPQGTGGSNFTASWGIDTINQCVCPSPSIVSAVASTSTWFGFDR